MGCDRAAHAEGWKASGADGRSRFGDARDVRNDDARRAAIETARDPLGLVRRYPDEAGDVVSERGTRELVGREVLRG